MPAIVLVDAHTGRLRRYEGVGKVKVLTHKAGLEEDQQVTFKVDTVERFRLMPDDIFKVDPPPTETPPRAGPSRAAVFAA